MTYRIENEPAYILHTRLYRESSLIVDVFTERHGRLSLIAKGARRPKSPWKGLLQPFIPLCLSFLGRSELKTLTGCELLTQWQHIPAMHLPSALYLNELMMKLVDQHLPMPELFLVYAQTLLTLSQVSDSRPALRRFETQFLSNLGYDLVLDVDADHQPIDEQAQYTYHLEAGAILCKPDNTGSVLRVSGAVLLAIAHERFDDPDLASAMRHWLGGLLAQLLQSEPASRHLIYREEEQT